MNHTVLIADDDAGFRECVKKVLESEDIHTVGAPDGSSALDIFKEQRVDAVLLDLKMPGLDGMATIVELRKISSRVPIIILTAYGDIPTAVAAIKSGAYDFIAKPPDFDQLVATLKAALGISDSRSCQKLLEGKRSCPALTEREHQILCLTAEGSDCKQIAQSLSISHRTVEKHREALMQKLGVHNKVELVRYALCKGIRADQD